ncbi:reprolysin-like metallopeptidase [Luteibacter sp. E-22]|uniref:reprolysin-like metallopeptidase n=1 Tax=Luteibacter sp. E-22 TaxID=3404050 RepID=UPI003CF395E5
MLRLTFVRAALAGAVLCIPTAGRAVADVSTLADLRKQLARLPMDGETATSVYLPLGDGRHGLFRVRDSKTLPPALAAKFPGLRSFRGIDADGRTVRLDLSPGGVRMSVRDGPHEWTTRASTAAEWRALPVHDAGTASFAAMAVDGLSPPRPAAGDRSASRGGGIRYDFRIAVAASSRYAAHFGGTTKGALAEIVHVVNQANEVFETDVGVHFTLVADNDRLIRPRPSRDPFRHEDPGPAAANLIDREIGAGNYDIGHALTDYTGGESHVGTSCSDARDADFLATHKAAAWSGHAHPQTATAEAVGFLIHVLGRQLGAWPTAGGCPDATLEGRAFEPGSGSTAMGFAPSTCGHDGPLQAHTDRYFHAANLEQMQDWLASRGGSCAFRWINPASAAWIDPESLAAQAVVPARTPFVLDARAEPVTEGRRLSYAWEQMDATIGRRDMLAGHDDGPLFRSFPPMPTGRRVFPRMAVVLGDEPAGPGEAYPTATRSLNFRLTVRDHGGEASTIAHADTRLLVVDTGRPFAVLDDGSSPTTFAGKSMTLRWDVADTDLSPISCHFVSIDLSLDDGRTWLTPALAVDEPNDGEARFSLPPDASSERARLRVACDWRPFFAVSPRPFAIRRIASH